MYNNGYYGGYSVYPAWPNPQNGAMPDQLAQYKQPYQMPPQPQVQPIQQPQQDIVEIGKPIWVQGEAGANAYPVAPGKTAWMMDSESNKFYIKTVDQNGRPMPLDRYIFTKEMESRQQSQNNDAYVLRTEVDEIINRMRRQIEDLTRRIESISPKEDTEHGE